MVSDEQNAALLQPISQEKVDEAMMQTPEGKALGPDGFIVDFFHYCWNFIKKQVWKIVE